MTGYLKYGDPLPSMSQLSENYHVGIRTVREVLAALKREGLIHTEERRTSRVAYQPVDEIQKEDVLRSVLERRTAILEVYKTMELIMPRLFACSIASCGGEKVRLSFQHLKRNSKKGIDLRWKASSMALHSLLDATCCFGIYLRVLKSARGFHFSWSSGSHRHFLLPPWLIKIQCGCWRQPIAAI